MDYARALAEHPKWRWEPGMMDTNGSAVLIVRDGDPLMAWYTPDRISDVGDEWATGAPPDINHPATKGWLLHMLIGVVEAVHFETAPHGGTEVYVKWSLNGETKRKWFSGDEALSAALLAVWGQA